MRIDYRIKNWIVSRLQDAEIALSPFDAIKTSEDEINAMGKRAATHAFARINCPCGICAGRGVLKSADGDWVACHSCIGTGIDIERAREAMRL